MRALRRGCMVAVVAFLASSPRALVAQSKHPLDGLTTQEHWAIYDALRASGRVDTATVVTAVLLREPPKAEVLAWKAGTPSRRDARVILLKSGKTIEAIVDVNAKKVSSWRELEGVQANMVWDEDDESDEIAKKDPRIRAALARRGITDLAVVGCGGFPPGFFDTPEQRGRRIMHVECTYGHGTYNRQSRHIPGLVAYVDLTEKKVLRVIDEGNVPVSMAVADYSEEVVGPPRVIATPISIEQPLGPAFRRDGGSVMWQNWSFHVRIDPRSGPVLSLVRYRDGSRERSVLYQGSLSEIFVPYMDPAPDWYDRNFLDAGEFFFEGLAETLEPGTDCPTNAAYMDDVVADEKGMPMQRERVGCIFERTTGDPAWRHGSEGPGRIDSRPSRELVMRAIAVVGNYDYVFDWVFTENGTIHVRVGATGKIEAKGVASRAVASDQGALASIAGPRDDQYGRFVADNLVGVNHDHYFSFRLDLDVDGTSNSLAIGRLKQQKLAADHPRRSIWVMEDTLARRERDGMLNMSMEEPALWRFVSATERSPLGYPTSYELAPGHNAMTLLSADDWPRRRAGFIEHHLWVTPYNPDERYAAGDFPSMSKSPDGLVKWTSANRPIANTDIVAWYTMAFHHVTRSEDWPVMPTMWHEFTLQPRDFFARNPALDLPKKP